MLRFVHVVLLLGSLTLCVGNSFYCNYMNVVPPNPNLNAANEFFPFKTASGAALKTSYFTANEFYNNTLSLMSASSSCPAIYFLISGGGWYTNTGVLDVSINLYSDPSRAAAFAIGTGSLTSSNFLPLWGIDPAYATYSNQQYVWYAGGTVTLTYNLNVTGLIQETCVPSNPGPIIFLQANSMEAAWGTHATFTNRVINSTEATQFFAPLFNTTSSQGPVYPTTSKNYSAYTDTTYDYVLMAWGSDGSYVPSSQTYVNYDTGLDLALGLKCASSCIGCPVAEFSGQCPTGQTLTAKTNGNCMVFGVDSTGPCSSSSITV